MLDQYYYSGHITIKFMCGCIVTLEISQESDLFLGASLEIHVANYTLCEKHKYLENTEDPIDTMGDWKSVLDLVIEEVAERYDYWLSYFQLLNDCDEFGISYDLDEFIRKETMC